MSESFLSEICNNIHDKNECLPLLRCGKSDGTRKQAANTPRAVTALSQSDPFRYWMFILCGCMGHSPSGMSAPSWRTFSSYCSSLHLLCYFPHLLSLSMFPPPLSCVSLPFLKYSFPEVPLSWLQGSAVPWSQPTEAILQPSTASTLWHAPVSKCHWVCCWLFFLKGKCQEYWSTYVIGKLFQYDHALLKK